MKISSIICALAFTLSFQAWSAEGKQAKPSLAEQFSGQGYGMAGCGLGSIVFGQQKGMVQIFAATTNGIVLNQSFGLTSGTSNCGDSARVNAANVFIEQNKLALEKDIARGQGETVRSLQALLECSNQNFASDLKINYSKSFPQGGANPSEVQAMAYEVCSVEKGS